MSTTNGEKDSLLGQTVLPPELGEILAGLFFLFHPLNENKISFEALQIVGQTTLLEALITIFEYQPRQQLA